MVIDSGEEEKKRMSIDSRQIKKKIMNKCGEEKRKKQKGGVGVRNKNKNADEPKDNMYGIWNFEINNLHYTQKQR